MRTLKFRIWSEEDKEYRSDIKISDLVIDTDGVQSTIYNSEGDRFDIEQYTGLDDKNGKEIYEGDIVKITGVKQNFVFVWDDDELGYSLEDDNKRRYVVWDNKYQVIGNIHENPELLEVEK